MNSSTVKQLESKSAGDDQINRAKDIAGSSESLRQQLEAFLATSPNRGQMNDFLTSFRSEAARVQLRDKAEALCRIAGIDQPSGADRLLAMQVGLLQEQNLILHNGMTRALNQMKSNSTENAAGVGDTITGSIAFGTLIGAVLVR